MRPEIEKLNKNTPQTSHVSISELLFLVQHLTLQQQLYCIVKCEIRDCFYVVCLEKQVYKMLI